MFVEYIAKEQRQNLADTLGKCKFFAVQTDGSSDSANLEEELILAFYFNPTSVCMWEVAICKATS